MKYTAILRVCLVSIVRRLLLRLIAISSWMRTTLFKLLVIRKYLKSLEVLRMLLLAILLIKSIWGCWPCSSSFYARRKLCCLIVLKILGSISNFRPISWMTGCWVLIGKWKWVGTITIFWLNIWKLIWTTSRWSTRLWIEVKSCLIFKIEAKLF